MSECNLLNQFVSTHCLCSWGLICILRTGDICTCNISYIFRYNTVALKNASCWTAIVFYINSESTWVDGFNKTRLDAAACHHNCYHPIRNEARKSNYVSIGFLLNTLRPTQNGGHFADNTFKCILIMTMFEFIWQLHWSLFPWVQLNYSGIVLDDGLAPNKQQAVIWNNDG